MRLLHFHLEFEVGLRFKISYSLIKKAAENVAFSPSILHIKTFLSQWGSNLFASWLFFLVFSRCIIYADIKRSLLKFQLMLIFFIFFMLWQTVCFCGISQLQKFQRTKIPLCIKHNLPDSISVEEIFFQLVCIVFFFLQNIIYWCSVP